VLDRPDLAQNPEMNNPLIHHTIDACHYLDGKPLSYSDDMSLGLSAITHHQEPCYFGNFCDIQLIQFGSFNCQWVSWSVVMADR
jgi:hypothetical protein